MEIKDQINKEQLPGHVAIIMDGNGRWARQRGKKRTFGHRNGVNAVKEVTEAAAELGINHLTLYAFSTENWRRPKSEVNALMKLLVQTLHKETKTLHDNNIRLQAIGDMDSLPSVIYKKLQEAIKDTQTYDRMSLTLALSYSSRWEITQTVRKISAMVKEGRLNEDEIDQTLVCRQLETAGIPDPELLIRTSGEYRISNFLLWQIAYTELYFTPVLWPDFKKENLYEAILDFQKRERRFGKISEQITKGENGC
mgnify:FL=1